MSPKAACAAKTRVGGRCQHPAGYGTEHIGYGTCKWHGGNSPSHKVKAQRQMVADSARTLGLPIDVDPVQAIVAELARGYGAIQWLQDQVGQIDPATLHEPWPRAMLRQLNEERDRNTRVATEAIRLGLEARSVTVAERQGSLMADMVRVALGAPELGLSAAQQKLALSLIARQMLRPAGDVSTEAVEVKGQMYEDLRRQQIPALPPAPPREPSADVGDEVEDDDVGRQPRETRRTWDDDGAVVIHLSDFGARRSGGANRG